MKAGPPLEPFYLAHVPVGAPSFMVYRPARTMRGRGAPVRGDAPASFLVSLDNTDPGFRLAVDEAFDDASEASQTAAARTRQIGTMRVASILMAFHRDPGVRTFSRWFAELSLNGRFRPDGRRLAFESSCKMTMAELDGFFGGTPKPAEESVLPFP